MRFITDNQTLDDLNILGKGSGESVYSVFNRTFTRGGGNILEDMFRFPFAEAPAIQRRIDIIHYFASLKIDFPFLEVGVAEQYIENTDERTKLSEQDNTIGKRLSNLITDNFEYKAIYKGVVSLLEIFQQLHFFANSIRSAAASTPYQPEIENIDELLAENDFQPLLQENVKNRFSYSRIAEYDKLLRFRHREKVKNILLRIYYIDVYFSIARIVNDRGYTLPVVLEKEKHTITVENFYHPLLEKPVANTVHITPGSNIIFLTGANMAGKSTLMKSLGIALYLAHVGFPVPASRMEFSVQDGIYTTINLADNLSIGASHFYAEVLRIKKVAKDLGASKNLFIIFDELFRGTNVKDAYEATIAITAAFAKKSNCIFVLSTHIMEAGEVLKQKCSNISFLYLPTTMKNNEPVYTYKLKEGITDDRHGMVIIKNEGILDILNKKSVQKVAS